MTPHAAILIEPSAKNTAAAICAAALALDAHVKCPITLVEKARLNAPNVHRQLALRRMRERVQTDKKNERYCERCE